MENKLNEKRCCKFCNDRLDVRIDNALPKEFQGTCSRNCWSSLVTGKTYKPYSSKYDCFYVVFVLCVLTIATIKLIKG